MYSPEQILQIMTARRAYFLTKKAKDQSILENAILEKFYSDVLKEWNNVLESYNGSNDVDKKYIIIKHPDVRIEKIQAFMLARGFICKLYETDDYERLCHLRVHLKV